MRISLRLFLAACITAVPLLAHGTPVSYTYDFKMTPSNVGGLGGTGTFTITTPLAANATYTKGSNLLDITFSIGGSTFTMADDTTTIPSITFQAGNIWNITYLDNAGTTPNRVELTTTYYYSYYYADLHSLAGGTFTDVSLHVDPPPIDSPGPNPPGAQTPEPSSFVLLGTGLLGMVGAARRRFSA